MASPSNTLEPELSSYSPPKTFLGIRSIALLEMALFFAILSVLDISFGNGDRFIMTEPHPFWVIILLVTVQYGTLEGLIATGMATFVLFAWHVPEQQVNQTIYDYWLSIVHRPLLWCCAAVILGELRAKHARETKELQEKFSLEEQKNATIAEAYNNLKRIKEKLETHMAGELQSTVAAYRALKSVGSLNPSRTLLGMEEIVSAVLSPEKFSIYALGPSGFESATCAGWEENEPYSRRFLSSTPLYHEVAARHRILCCVNDEDAKILGNEGILAGPLIDTDTGNVFGMLKIEDMGFHKLTLSNVETFRILCEVAGISHSNAERYQQVEANSLVNYDNHLLSHTFYQKQLALFAELAKWSGFQSCSIALHVDNARNFTTSDKTHMGMALKHLVETSLHEVTQIFNGKKTGHDYYLFLPGQNEVQGQHTLKSLKTALLGTKDHLLKQAEFSVYLNVLQPAIGKAANA